MREEIIADIRSLAAEIGRPPGSRIFEAETGLSAHHWRGVYWARWSEALAEAGFEPNLRQAKADPEVMLEQLAIATRRHGRFPTADELNLYRRAAPAPSRFTLSRHFGRRAVLVVHLRRWAAARPGYADVVAVLPPDPAPAARNGRPGPGPQGAPCAPGEAGGFVRLFRCDGRHHLSRIGDADGRHRSPQPFLPSRAVLKHAIRTDDPVGVEAYWRRRFTYRRLASDWFALTPADVAAFKRWREI